MKHLLVSKQRIATDASCGDIAASAKTQAKQMAERVIAKYPTIRYIGSVFTIAVVDIPETISIDKAFEDEFTCAVYRKVVSE